uniref:Uncharacterized protein n=1 Tax=Heterorhabditis bacteriophora TaxID=37862 RepID=A0A1I7WV46_HETBA
MTDSALGSESPLSTRSKDNIATIKVGLNESESPQFIHAYHRGSGNLKGGGLQKIYVSNKPYCIDWLKP